MSVGARLPLLEGSLPASLFKLFNTLLPALFSLIAQSWLFTPFSPKQLIFTPITDLLPLLLAPWTTSPPTFTFGGLVSRIIHLILLIRLPYRSISIAHCYLLWLAIAGGRTLVAFILTRAFGWAFPPFFSHSSLYEDSAGFGPALLVYIHLTSQSKMVAQLLKVPPVHGPLGSDAFVMIGLCGVLSFLEGMPWTYTIASIGAFILPLGWKLISRRLPVSQPNPLSMNPSSVSSSHSINPGQMLLAMVLSWLVISLPYLPSNIIPNDMPIPLISPPNAGPLLEILILSAPRPDPSLGALMLKTTVGSFIPRLSPSIHLTVFSHLSDRPNPAFDALKAEYAANATLSDRMSIYMDQDVHPTSYTGQFLHMSEAFRHLQDTSYHGQAEWVMLVEDDFPICGGQHGWNSILNVLNLLEESRKRDNLLKSGFVGTGGR
jgi:hypothetical protein